LHLCNKSPENKDISDQREICWELFAFMRRNFCCVAKDSPLRIK